MYCNNYCIHRLLVAVLILLCSTGAHAQIGSKWVAYSPAKRVHLDDDKRLTTGDWVPYRAVCEPICADYKYNDTTDTETFRILDKRSNRSEIKLQNDYSKGSRQFEGYVTIFSPLNDESVMQIFGSTEGATQLMVRGFSDGNGSLRVGDHVLVKGIYGKEVRLNVIHLQEDAGNKIIIYIDGVKKFEMPDNEAVTNYHKYGNYGTMRTEKAIVQWRAVKSFKDGKAE